MPQRFNCRLAPAIVGLACRDNQMANPDEGVGMSDFSEFRKAKDEFFATDAHSPLTPQLRQSFHGLEYYPENPDLRLVVGIEEFPDHNKQATEMSTNTGDSQRYLRWGTFSFVVDGEAACLTVYRGMEGDEFFLPFTDATSGQESYGGGRYLDVVPLDADHFLVDFNYAYNPYCAYNSRWSCPIPPPENRLRVPIRAGEKNFPGAVVH